MLCFFLNSASSAAALVFYLSFSGPSMKSGANTEKNRERPESRIYFEILEKTTCNEHPVLHSFNVLRPG